MPQMNHTHIAPMMYGFIARLVDPKLFTSSNGSKADKPLSYRPSFVIEAGG
jgi:hypothetical protein